MACPACNKSLVGRVATAISKVEDFFTGNTVSEPPAELSEIQAPRQSIDSTSGNVFGDPTARLRANGTNSKYLK